MSGVELREVQPADLPVFYEHQRDLEACQLAGFASREREAFMAHWQRIMADETNILRTILFEGQVVGNVVSFLMEGKREVGYWIGRAFWGRGIASQALAAFLAEDAQRPLYAHVVRHNAGSQRVLEKCGFLRTVEDGQGLVYCLEGERVSA